MLPREARLSRSQVRWREPRSVPVRVSFIRTNRGSSLVRLEQLAADTFESYEEVEEFLAFTYAERHRDLV